jgi:carbamoyl-phosphate synthase large subunit
VSAKVAIGLRLDEIPNAVTRKTLAAFEPALDYVVVKIPRWPFDKFTSADRSVTTQMKATGEVMAIARVFESALMKAIRGLEQGVIGLRLKGAAQWSEMQLEELLKHPTDERLFAVLEALRRGWLVQEIHDLTDIDPWFLTKLQGLIDLEAALRREGEEEKEPGEILPDALLFEAKRKGFPDREIAHLTGLKEEDIRARRKAMGLTPAYKMVDTCAAEFEAMTPYFYSSYEPAANDEARKFGE